MRLEKPSEIIDVKLKEIVVCGIKTIFDRMFCQCKYHFFFVFFLKNKEREINTRNFGRQMYNQ